MDIRPYRVLLIVSMTTAVIIGLLFVAWGVWFVYTQALVEEVWNEQMAELSREAREVLRYDLALPSQLTMMLLGKYARGELPAVIDVNNRYYCNLLESFCATDDAFTVAFTEPTVIDIGYSTPDGSYIGCTYYGDVLAPVVADASTGGVYTVFKADAVGNRDPLSPLATPSVELPYTAYKTRWSGANPPRETIWEATLVDDSLHLTQFGHTPVFGTDGSFVGALSVRLQLGPMTDQLVAMAAPSGNKSSIVLVDQNMRLTASSSGEVATTSGGSPHRIDAIDDEGNPAIASAVRYFAKLRSEGRQYVKGEKVVSCYADVGMDVAVLAGDLAPELWDSKNRIATSLLDNSSSIKMYLERTLDHPLLRLTRVPLPMAQPDWFLMVLVQRSFLDSITEANGRFIMLITLGTLCFMGVSINIAIARLRKKLHRQFPWLTIVKNAEHAIQDDADLIFALRPLVLEGIKLSDDRMKAISLQAPLPPPLVPPHPEAPHAGLEALVTAEGGGGEGIKADEEGRSTLLPGQLNSVAPPAFGVGPPKPKSATQEVREQGYQRRKDYRRAMDFEEVHT
jgi:hypothetical protein